MTNLNITPEAIEAMVVKVVGEDGKKGMTLDHARSLLSRGFGMISMGGGLGLMLSTPDNAVNCPAGWLFVDATDKKLTPEKLVENADCARLGRSTWPPADGDKKRGERKLGTAATRRSTPLHLL